MLNFETLIEFTQLFIDELSAVVRNYSMWYSIPVYYTFPNKLLYLLAVIVACG